MLRQLVQVGLHAVIMEAYVNGMSTDPSASLAEHEVGEVAPVTLTHSRPGCPGTLECRFGYGWETGDVNSDRASDVIAIVDRDVAARG